MRASQFGPMNILVDMCGKNKPTFLLDMYPEMEFLGHSLSIGTTLEDTAK